MPELPEVEVIRQGLLPLVKGRKIAGFGSSGKRLRTEVPEECIGERLVGAVITGIERKAKYLLFTFDSGDLLTIHLGMTGRLTIFPAETPPARHDHLFFLLDNGRELRFNDTRRFGSVQCFKNAEKTQALRRLFATTGPEPFSAQCTPAYLHARARNRSQAVKTFIMNSAILAGVGNIYANESLFAAGIHPATPAGTLTPKQWQLLLDKIRDILNWAIACGGSTISDFQNAGGQSGYFQINFRVYGRRQKPCVRCSTPLAREVIGGRASYFCPRCQKRK